MVRTHDLLDSFFWNDLFFQLKRTRILTIDTWIGSFAGTSNMLVSNIAYVNFTGWLDSSNSNRTASVSCSNRHPCYNIDMKDISLRPTQNSTALGAVGSCSYIDAGGVHGMEGSGCS